jgi:hypothetical protein
MNTVGTEEKRSL